MTCTFCVTEENFGVLEFGMAVQLLDHLMARGIGTVTFGGGEPFTWQGNVVALAREAKQRGLRVQIGTNGIALPDDFATLDCIDRYVLPLEASDPAVHDTMRTDPRRSHHATIIERLAELQHAGKSVTISTVVTAANLHDILNLAEFLRGYHRHAGSLHAWHLYQFLPLGRGGRANERQLTIPAEEYRLICDAVKALDLPFKVFQRRDMYRPSSIEFYWAKDRRIVCGSESLHGESETRTSGLQRIL
jgi:MoaA/NifB/PqqE/SkfB family radical SAM enzyme